VKSARKLFAAVLFLTVSLLFSTAARAQTPHVFYVPPGGNLWELTYNASNGSWVTTNTFDGQVPYPLNTTIASFAGGGKIYVCYFNNTNGEPPNSVYVMSSTNPTNNEAWTTAAASAVNVDVTSGLTGVVDASGIPRIFYVALYTDGVEYLYESYWTGSGWENIQLYGGVKAGSVLSAYLYEGTVHVYYIAVDGSIHQHWLVGSTWYDVDVTVDSGGPYPVSGSPLVTYQYNSQASIYFIANDNHVHQDFYVGSSWANNDVTEMAGAPNCYPGSSLTGYMYAGDPRINYIAVDGHIHQMWWTGSKEATDDWTSLSGAVPPLIPSPLTGYSFNGQATVFYAILSGQYYLGESYYNGSQTLRYEFGLEDQGGTSPNGLAYAVF
jgi:hypothetical protein